MTPKGSADIRRIVYGRRKKVTGVSIRVVLVRRITGNLEEDP
jgi:hypothetical protein